MPAQPLSASEREEIRAASNEEIPTAESVTGLAASHEVGRGHGAADLEASRVRAVAARYLQGF